MNDSAEYKRGAEAARRKASEKDADLDDLLSEPDRFGWGDDYDKGFAHTIAELIRKRDANQARSQPLERNSDV
jgi:hypothetical protein